MKNREYSDQLALSGSTVFSKEDVEFRQNQMYGALIMSNTAWAAL